MEDGVQEQEISAEPATTPTAGASRAKEKSTGGGGGWGGWGTSALSVFSDLQKVAADVAGEISKNAVAAAKGAAKGVADLQQSVVNSIDEEFKDSQSDTEEEIKVKEPEPLSAEDIKRKAALDKLQEASKDSLLGQGLKAFDESVETIASGALAALGNAWKGSVTLVQKLEHSAENLAGTIQQGGLTAKAGSLAPSIIEGSKALTARGFKVLEYVGKETLDMLAAEAGIDFDNDLASSKEGAGAASETYNEDVSFDHCFIIYGGPEHLEELESLANHYTLLCNRARAKLVGEAKINFDTTLKQLQPVLTLDDDTDEGSVKGKRVEAGYSFSENEVKALQESSISKAAEMTTGFTAALGGLAMKEVVKKTSDRLEAIRAEGVHRISELCAVCLSHLLLLGKSVLTSTSDKSDKSDDVEDLDWPEDCIGKASLISARARAMAGDIKAVSDSFVTGIGDVTAAFDAALKNERRVADEQGEALRERELKEGTLEDRAQAVRSGIESDGAAAIEKIQDGLQHLTYMAPLKASSLHGQKMSVASSAARVTMAAAGKAPAAEAPAGFTPPELKADTPSPIFGGSTGGLLRKAQVEEFYVITWDSPKEQIFEMPTGGAAIMRSGPNLLKLARKEQCLALGTALRTKFKIKYQFYRVFPNGEVQYLHPKDGVYPEKVNAGRTAVGFNSRSIGKNKNPAEIKFGKAPAFEL